MSVRPETEADHDAVRAINRAAFDDGPEPALVDALRASCPGHLSLVAEDEGRVIGHILFTPVVIGPVEDGIEGMGLGPMAVLPECRGIGVGSALVRRGLELLRDRSCPFVVVVGHPGYYPRFGFEMASVHGLESQWEGVPDEAFMVRIVDRDALPAEGGIARYRDEFDAAM
jgi:putative acetyltransferase